MVEQQLRAGRYRTPEEVVARALEALVGERSSLPEETDRSQAVEDMLEFAGKHRFTLGERFQIRDLIHEGHKY